MRIFIGLFILQIAIISNAQDPSEILRKHFEDYGQDQWNEIRSVTIEGRFVDEEFYGCPMKLSMKQDEKIRIDGTYKGKKFAEAYNGLTAWIVAPWRERYEIESPKTIEELALINTLNFGSPLYQFREHLKFSGIQDFEGELYYTFDLDETSLLKTFYIGQDDYRLYFEKISTRFGNPQVTVLKVIEKYKNYGELLMPTATIFEGDDFYKELIFDQVYLNMGVNDQVFERPEK